MAKEKKDINTPLVRRVDLPATFQKIPKGETATYTCVVLGNYATVYSAVSRLNKKAGYERFGFRTHDNGATYHITNNG